MAPAATQVAGGPPRAVKTSGGGGEEENLAFRAFFRDAVLPAISRDRAAPAAAATDGPEHAELMKTGAGRDIIAHAAPMLENISVLKIGRALRGKADAFRLVGAMLGRMSALTELSLEWNEMGEVQMDFLAAPLQTLTGLTSLDVGRNRLGANGARALAQALPALSALSRLDLASNRIGAFGAEFVADALKRLTKLTTLRLGQHPPPQQLPPPPKASADLFPPRGA